MARPALPNYPIDGEPIYVPDADTAWDHARIEQERAANPDDRHPYDAYRSGETRSRLEPVQEYLDMTRAPELWHIRELPPAIRRECEALLAVALRGATSRDGKLVSMSAEAQAAWLRCDLLAFKHGVARVENTPFELHWERDGSVADRTINEIDRLAPGLVADIGAAVRLAFRPLSSAEGK